MTVASQQSDPHVHTPATGENRCDEWQKKKEKTPLEKHTHAHTKHVGIKSCVLSSDMLSFYQLNIKWRQSLWQGNKSILTETLRKNISDKEDRTRWDEIKQRPLKEINTSSYVTKKKKNQKLSYHFCEEIGVELVFCLSVGSQVASKAGKIKQCKLKQRFILMISTLSILVWSRRCWVVPGSLGASLFV